MMSRPSKQRNIALTVLMLMTALLVLIVANSASPTGAKN